MARLPIEDVRAHQKALRKEELARPLDLGAPVETQQPTSKKRKLPRQSDTLPVESDTGEPHPLSCVSLKLTFCRGLAEVLHYTVVSFDPDVSRSETVDPVDVDGVPRATLGSILDAAARMLEMPGGVAKLLERFVVRGVGTLDLDVDMSVKPGGGKSTNNPFHRRTSKLVLRNPDFCDHPSCGVRLDETGNAAKKYTGRPSLKAASLRVCNECPEVFSMVLAGEHYECKKVSNSHKFRFTKA